MSCRKNVWYATHFNYITEQTRYTVLIFGKCFPVLLMNKNNKKLKGNSWLAVTFTSKCINYKRVMSELNQNKNKI